jgi:hypothetical protein
MLKSLLGLFFLCCSLTVQNNNRKIFDEFQLAYKQRDFKKIDELMSDDFTAIDEYGKVAFNKADYIAQMKGWAAVFDAKWGVKNVMEKGDSIISMEDDTDILNDYFYNGHEWFQFIYTFKNNRLATLRWDSLPGYAERQKSFDEKYGAFYNWVNQNHPAETIYFGKLDSASVSEIKKMFLEYLPTNTK